MARDNAKYQAEKISGKINDRGCIGSTSLGQAKNVKAQSKKCPVCNREYPEAGRKFADHWRYEQMLKPGVTRRVTLRDADGLYRCRVQGCKVNKFVNEGHTLGVLYRQHLSTCHNDAELLKAGYNRKIIHKKKLQQETKKLGDSVENDDDAAMAEDDSIEENQSMDEDVPMIQDDDSQEDIKEPEPNPCGSPIIQGKYNCNCQSER
jgi:hypothetical protein